MKKRNFMLFAFSVLFIAFSVETLADQKDDIKKQLYPNTRWFPIYVNEYGEFLAIDPYELLKERNINSNIKKFWVKIIYSKESLKKKVAKLKEKGLGKEIKKYKLENAHSGMTFYLFDCEKKTYDSIYFIVKDKEGNELFTSETENWKISMKPIIPEDPLEDIYTIACSSPEKIKDWIKQFKQKASKERR